jgi:hypothetical protein
MDAERTGKVFAVGEGPRIGGDHSYPVSFDGTTFRRADAETGHTLVAGDTPTGFFARLEPCVSLAPGHRLAHVNAALLRFVDEEYGAGIGALQAAPDLRL